MWARPMVDRRRQFLRTQLGYCFAEFGAQLLGTYPADVAADSSRRGLRELLSHRGEPRALLHLLGEPLGEPPHFILLLGVVDRETDLGYVAMGLRRGVFLVL